MPVDDEVDLAALRANLALTPAQRFAELVEMNRFHAEVQARTLPAWLRAALEAREVEEARRRIEALGPGSSPGGPCSASGA